MKINTEYYYKNFKIELPYNYQHRCFKLLLDDECGSKKLNSKTNQGKLPYSGRWLKVWRVRNSDELRQKLITFHPAAAYISTSTYLDPLHVSMKWKTQRRGEYKERDNHILSSDFVIDFDDSCYDENLKRKISTDPVEDLQNAYHYLNNYTNLRDFKVINTDRGFHLWCLDFYDKRCRGQGPQRSHEREIFILMQKARLANELSKHGVHFDYKVTVDTRRVVRLWNSLHQNQFTICSCFDNVGDAIKSYNSYHTHKLIMSSTQGGQKSVTSNNKTGSNPMTSNGYDGGDVVKRSLVEKTPDSVLEFMGSPITLQNNNIGGV